MSARADDDIECTQFVGLAQPLAIQLDGHALGRETPVENEDRHVAGTILRCEADARKRKEPDCYEYPHD